MVVVVPLAMAAVELKKIWLVNTTPQRNTESRVLPSVAARPGDGVEAGTVEAVDALNLALALCSAAERDKRLMSSTSLPLRPSVDRLTSGSVVLLLVVRPPSLTTGSVSVPSGSVAVAPLSLSRTTTTGTV